MYSAAWLTAIRDPFLEKQFLLTLDFRGIRYFVAEKAVGIVWTNPEGEVTEYLFEPGLFLDETVKAAITSTSSLEEISSVNLELPGTFRVQDNKQRCPLSSGTGELSLWLDGIDFKDRLVLLQGVVRGPSWGTDDEPFLFTLQQESSEQDLTFPPVEITDTNWPYATDSSIGLPYPVVYGEKTTLLYCIDDGAKRDTNNPNSNTSRQLKFVVAGHAVKEVTNLWKEEIQIPIPYQDDPDTTNVGWGNSTYTSDNDGNPLTTVFAVRRKKPRALETDSDPDSEEGDWEHFTSGNRISATIKGLSRKGVYISTFGEMIEDMLIYYSNFSESDMDMFSIGNMKSRLKFWKCSSVFNDSGSTVLQTLEQRILPQIPVVMGRRSNKLFFSVVDYRNLLPILHLEKGIQILDRLSPVQETDRAEVFNEFTVNYGFSFQFDDFTKTVTRDKKNDRRCSRSVLKYGDSSKETMEAPDIDDPHTADLLIDYLVDLYGNLHEEVSYRCTHEIAILRPGALVSVTDPDFGYVSTWFSVQSMEFGLDFVDVTIRTVDI